MASLQWRRLLRLYHHNSKKTKLQNTIRRPSKRYHRVPGIKVKNRSKIVVALDTSGSIPNREFQRFFGEIHAIWKTQNEVHILECDDQIQASYPYKGLIPVLVQGRGNTQFDAPIVWANQEKADLLLYFTDGYGPPPKIKERMPIIWLISSQGIRSNQPEWAYLPGRKLKLPA